MIYGNTAADMDRMLGTHEHRRHLSRSDAGIGCHELDARYQLCSHGALTLRGQHLAVGTKQILLLCREGPAATGKGMVAVPTFKLIAGESGLHVLLQRMQKLIHRKDRVVPQITGVSRRNLFIPDKEQCLRGVQSQAGIQDICQILALKLRQSSSADLRTIQKGLVCRGTDGIQVSTDAQCQTKIGCGVNHCILTDARRKVRGLAEQRRAGVQGFNVQLVDLTAAPGGALAQRFVIGEHCRVGVKRDCIVVVTG